MFRAMGHANSTGSGRSEAVGEATGVLPSIQHSRTATGYQLRQICHDARQELALIGAMAERLESSRDLNADQRTQIGAVLTQVRGLASMLRTALATSGPEEVDLRQLLGDVADQVQLVSKATIECSRGSRLPVECDPLWARRAVLNLLDNAVRAAGPNGIVQLRAGISGNRVVLEVEDSGPGFGGGPAGVGSIGLSVVRDWVAREHGSLEITRGSLGGVLVRVALCKAQPVVPIPVQRAR